jgi:UDP-N-acetylglucosamine:LPS N-acetylglucosamine transferase
MYNPALYRSVRLVNPDATCITIPVDFEEAQPRYWFTPKVEQHYFIATDRLAEQARQAGIPDPFIHRLPGFIVDPEFYQVPRLNIVQERVRLGLDPELPTGLVSFGGQGSILLSGIARCLAQSGLKLNLIFLCGRNQTVYDELSRAETPYCKLVLGYTRETPIYYQRLADFVIGKPGTMTITEALITRTPLIAIESRGMKPVQHGNEDWVRERGTGIIVEGLDKLAQAVIEVSTSRSYLHRAEQEFHRGVFEATDLISSLSAEPARQVAALAVG